MLKILTEHLDRCRGCVNMDRWLLFDSEECSLCSRHYTDHYDIVENEEEKENKE